MEEQRNVKWILIISIIMFFVSAVYGQSLFFLGPYYPYGAREWSIWDRLWYYISRIDVLIFIATITTATLFTTNFGKKELTYKLTVYLFIVSMGLFFLGFIRLLFL